MGNQAVPIIITTIGALEVALREEFPLLYLDELLYLRHSSRCLDLLTQYGCRLVLAGKKGMFYQRKLTDSEPDIHPEDIYDPMHIL